MTPHSQGKKKKAKRSTAVIIARAGTNFGMLDNTVATILFAGPKLDEDVDGEGWRNRVSQYKGKLWRTK